MSLHGGVQLGSFEIVRPLGTGGMGEVYLAHDRDLDRPVAVKVLRADVTQEPRRTARFAHEARAASALSHPNVCHIYQVGETPDGRRYIAMEYVEGETLGQRLQRARLTLAEALDIAVQIAAALTATHAAGIVHRDIKPENVMIRRDRVVKVLDFGLAKLAAPEAPLAAPGATQSMGATQPGTLVGTTEYMSPEQARGHEVDGRTDVWALGVVLYEMVAGHAPFTGPSRSDLIVAILDRDPLPLACVNPAIPGELERIAGKALRKEPDQRYQGMNDLLLDLEALRGEVIARTRRGASANGSMPSHMADARRNPGADSMATSRRMRRNVTAGVAAMLLVVLTAGGWWTWQASHRSPGRGAEPPGRWNYPYTRLTFGPGLQTDPAFSPDGKFIAYASDRAGNFDIWVQALGGNSEPIQVTKTPDHDTQPAWSPDGTTIAFRSERSGGGVFLVPAFGGAERRLTSSGSHPAWSADGSEILFFVGRTPMYRVPVTRLSLHVVSLDGAPPREILGDFLRDGWWVWAASHPDGRISVLGMHRTRGRAFFTVSRDGEQVTTSAPLALESDQFRFPGAVPFRFQWSAAGTMLYLEAAVSETRSLWRVRVDPATLDWLSAERLTTPSGRDIAPVLTRDGKRIAFSQQNEASRMLAFPLDLTGSRPRIAAEGTVLTEEGAVASMPSLSPDGSKLAHELRRPGMDRSELWAIDVDGDTRELLTANATAPVWSRDGTRVAYTYSHGNKPPFETAVAYRQLGGTERFLTPRTSRFDFVPTDWTPDGRAVLGLFMLRERGTPPTSVVLWPTTNPKAEQPERVLLSSPAGAQIWCATFSPDSRWIVFTVARPGQGTTEPSLQLAVARPATPPDQWVYLATDHRWPDKPRWGSDGQAVFFISTGSTPYLNLWGARFDAARGQAVGQPFALTQFDSPQMAISPYVDDSFLGISPRHAVLQMRSITGSIWMLEDIDR